MFWEYSLYIFSIVFGTVILNLVFKLRPVKEIRLLVMSILPVLVLFTVWDVVAVYRGFWSFNMRHMLGLMFINQPVEEISFFLAVPFYYITIWELAKKLRGRGE